VRTPFPTRPLAVIVKVHAYGKSKVAVFILYRSNIFHKYMYLHKNHDKEYIPNTKSVLSIQ
jgi:hypothetical protein